MAVCMEESGSFKLKYGSMGFEIDYFDTRISGQ